jgi:hypothetical protein
LPRPAHPKTLLPVSTVLDPRAPAHLGFGLLRATAAFPFRLLGLGRTPLALTGGARGRAGQRVLERPPLAVRSLGADLDPTGADLDVAFPHATDRLAVFVPAPGDDESSWAAGADAGAYGPPLASALGWTPVHLRVDDTVPVGVAAVELSALLQQLVSSWPVKARRIALIGHAGGGLVARGACGVRAVGRRPWTDRVTDVVALGTPHLAASPQRGSLGLGRRLGEELAGLVESDDAVIDVPPLDRARYYLVTDRATHTSNPLGRALGNLLWWRERATLRHRDARELFPTAARYQVSTRRHPFVSHPEIQHALFDWLA